MAQRFALILAALSLACGTTDGRNSPDGGANVVDAGGDAGIPDTSVTRLTGTLGDLGPVEPTVSSLYISNSGETLVYMSSAAITCSTLQNSRWLGSTTSGSQVVEIVISGDPAVKTFADAEVNYAKGGRSSSYEKNADSASVTFTKVEANSVVEGTLSATYGANSISGTFHATFCANGQGY